MKSIIINMVMASALIRAIRSENSVDMNCTKVQLHAVEICASLNPFAVLSIDQNNNNSGLIYPSLILTQPLNINMLKQSCAVFSNYTDCTQHFDEETKKCLTNAIDVQKRHDYFNYLCQTVMPMVNSTLNNTKLKSCWRSTSCKLLSSAKSYPTETPTTCLLLTLLELQLNCALDQGKDQCQNPPTEVLLEARADTLDLLASFQCSEFEEKGITAVESSIIELSTPELQQPTQKSSMTGMKCSLKQNADAKICIKELWGIEKYMDNLANGTFWSKLMQNDSTWPDLCERVEKHQGCIESKLDQNDDSGAQAPCLFDVQIQNFAAFAQMLCDDDILRKSIYPKCKLSSSGCEPTADYINSNFTLIVKNNEPSAFCNLYKSAELYFNCTIQDGSKCFEDIQKVKTNMQQNSVIVGCSDKAHDVGKMTTSEGNLTQQETTSKVIAEIINCTKELEDECSKYQLNPITITVDPNVITKDYCNNNDLLIRCSSCKYLSFASSIQSIHGYICSVGSNDYEKSRSCLTSVLQEPILKKCLGGFSANITAEDSLSSMCLTTNNLLNCSYPIISQMCGSPAAVFHLNVLHNFATTVSSESTCKLVNPITTLITNETGTASNEIDTTSTIVDYIDCSEDEKTLLAPCNSPFKKLLSDLENVSKGGLSSLITGLKNVSQAVKDGCKLRRRFETCVRKSLKFDTSSTSCRISSCAIKVGDTACAENVTTKSLENSIRCMFSLITDAKFQLCVKIFPKEALSSLAKLKPYFQQFITCIQEPVMKKCGQQSWQLAKSFTSGKNDSTCILDFNNTNLWPKLPMESEPELTSGQNLTSSTKLESAIVTDNSTICTTEQIDKFEDCSNVLGDYKPVPIMIFEDKSKIDRACPLYNNYQNCIRKYKCFYPLAEAYKSLLYNVCTTYYDAYKSNAICLKRAAYSAKVQVCINKFRATDLRSISSNLPDLGCKTVTELLKCAGDTVDFTCGTEGLNLLYNLYRPFSQTFLDSCTPNRTDIGPPKKECTREQRTVYYECRNKIKLNPISLMNDTDEFNSTCQYFGSDFQKCIIEAPCLPQPAHQAFNDTMSYFCFEELNKQDFTHFNPCLSQAASTTAGRMCTSDLFNNITWDDPGRMVCRKLNQALDCGYPLVTEHKCHPDSMILIYNVFSLMAMRYRSGCLLNVPPNVQITKFVDNMTMAVPMFVTQKMLDVTTGVPLRTTTGGGYSTSLTTNQILAMILLIALISRVNAMRL